MALIKDSAKDLFLEKYKNFVDIQTEIAIARYDYCIPSKRKTYIYEENEQKR